MQLAFTLFYSAEQFGSIVFTRAHHGPGNFLGVPLLSVGTDACHLPSGVTRVGVEALVSAYSVHGIGLPAQRSGMCRRRGCPLTTGRGDVAVSSVRLPREQVSLLSSVGNVWGHTSVALW